MKPKISKKVTQKKRKTSKVKNTTKMKEESDALMPENSDEETDEENDMVGASKLNQKEYLEKLKKSDPEFYKAMMNSEDLIHEGSSDDDSDDLKEASDDEEDEDGDEPKLFKPPKVLEEQVDSEDEDVPTNHKSANIIDMAMLDKLEKDLSGSSPLNAFRDMEQALLAAIESLGGHEDEEVTSRYRVEGPQVFNAVVKLCLQNASGALQRILHLKNADDDPSKSKKWSKMKNFIKPYLRHMVKLTAAIAEAEIAVVILKRGIIPLLGYYSAHPIAGKVLMRRLITMWSTSNQRVRVLAYVCIFRLTRALKSELLDGVLKKMYLAYVQNCRFTSPSTWGMIDFMRVSLVELYSLDRATAYRQAFVYIRQMAFHLRNAILVMKKEKIQMVYNWQYIHCLHLWSALLSRTHPDPILQPLIYPLTQIAIGTIKLQSSAKYYPLVFHICSILTDLSHHTDTFIPVLPFLLELINGANLNKKHLKASIKPFQWMCILKFSKSQMAESAFKDGVVEQFYNSVLKYLNVEAASIGFPELVVPAVYQLKLFLKKCKNPNYTKKIKQLIEKINENSTFISLRRKDVQFVISDTKAVKDWEIECRQVGTPLSNYYNNWSKIHKKDLLRLASNKDEMDSYDLPMIKKRVLDTKKEGKEKTAFDDPFGSDDDSDSDDDSRFLSKKEKAEKRKAADAKPEEESEESDADDDDEPPNKKSKAAETLDDESESDHDVVQSTSKDVVKEMTFSDLEDSDEVDEFDANSEEETDNTDEDSDSS